MNSIDKARSLMSQLDDSLRKQKESLLQDNQDRRYACEVRTRDCYDSLTAHLHTIAPALLRCAEVLEDLDGRKFLLLEHCEAIRSALAELEKAGGDGG